jgi:DNA polymerase III epsilon subunit-like protein
MVVAAYLNDRAAMHARPVEFNKITLEWVAKVYHIHNDRAHDALQDCIQVANVYKEMCRQGILA